MNNNGVNQQQNPLSVSILIVLEHSYAKMEVLSLVVYPLPDKEKKDNGQDK